MSVHSAQRQVRGESLLACVCWSPSPPPSPGIHSLLTSAHAVQRPPASTAHLHLSPSSPSAFAFLPIFPSLSCLCFSPFPCSTSFCVCVCLQPPPLSLNKPNPLFPGVVKYGREQQENQVKVLDKSLPLIRWVHPQSRMYPLMRSRTGHHKTCLFGLKVM